MFTQITEEEALALFKSGYKGKQIDNSYVEPDYYCLVNMVALYKKDVDLTDSQLIDYYTNVLKEDCRFRCVYEVDENTFNEEINSYFLFDIE